MCVYNPVRCTVRETTCMVREIARSVFGIERMRGG